MTRRRLDKINETNRRRYEERRAAGLCFRCCHPVCDGSAVYCGEHLIEMRNRVKRHLLKRLTTGPKS